MTWISRGPQKVAAFIALALGLSAHPARAQDSIDGERKELEAWEQEVAACRSREHVTIPLSAFQRFQWTFASGVELRRSTGVPLGPRWVLAPDATFELASWDSRCVIPPVPENIQFDVIVPRVPRHLDLAIGADAVIAPTRRFSTDVRPLVALSAGNITGYDCGKAYYRGLTLAIGPTFGASGTGGAASLWLTFLALKAGVRYALIPSGHVNSLLFEIGVTDLHWYATVRGP